MHTSIQLRKLNKSFADKVLFSDLSYTFKRQAYHLIGKNGVGKSILLKLIVGLELPDSGSIVLNDKYLVTANELNKKNLFYVPDDLAIYPFLTGEEFLVWMAKARTNNPGEINYLVKQLDVQSHLKTAFGNMSFGTKKKFLLISALIGHPEFIILDEPLNGLDTKSQHTLLLLLKEKLNDCGMILTTHHDANLELLETIKVEIVNHHVVDVHETSDESMVV
ncbi:ABC transporter ATP-binding protein [Legionella jordanis]|uniref:ABC transporter ATP-binding protein n=1 Tax=Legionella jordanis TaxID=456 RepID=A0A0W0VDS5_9GAMM|nr:ATP-binding cassette domain-containing protein [Legionella jordanis]KTD18276.1 ABC transporter ATP-binding protein [Legionella jordanis]RMX05194.1 ABC transporter ATP-binding protein [Legionella jordanis]RMX17450.1 ABC transporter ATP-binding protein [Legionella jordanis]VEH13381.1 ABC transporter ATP-binding protein [Legionella jordanis]HAT8713723.1 ATP-binding cassette domain-containing protein [Legionella jordanis]